MHIFPFSEADKDQALQTPTRPPFYVLLQFSEEVLTTGLSEIFRLYLFPYGTCSLGSSISCCLTTLKELPIIDGSPVREDTSIYFQTISVSNDRFSNHVHDHTIFHEHLGAAANILGPAIIMLHRPRRKQPRGVAGSILPHWDCSQF